MLSLLRVRSRVFLSHISDMVCVQESMVTKTREHAIRGEAWSAGKQYFSGSPPVEQIDVIGCTGPAKGQGLAVLCKDGSQWFGLDEQLGGEQRTSQRAPLWMASLWHYCACLA